MSKVHSQYSIRKHTYAFSDISMYSMHGIFIIGDMT